MTRPKGSKNKPRTWFTTVEFATDDVAGQDRVLAQMEEDGWTYVDNFPSVKPQHFCIKFKRTP